jgi:hypothetical protein
MERYMKGIEGGADHQSFGGLGVGGKHCDVGGKKENKDKRRQMAAKDIYRLSIRKLGFSQRTERREICK